MDREAELFAGAGPSDGPSGGPSDGQLAWAGCGTPDSWTGRQRVSGGITGRGEVNHQPRTRRIDRMEINVYIFICSFIA